MHELRDSASDAIEEIVDLWKVQRTRVERYGDEQGLEEGFIQPVLRSLGWKLKYQAFLQGREPDYALFPMMPASIVRWTLGETRPSFGPPGCAGRCQGLACQSRPPG